MSAIQNNNKELELACLEGDLKKVVSLTTNSALNNLITIPANNNYPLKAACYRGHLEIVKFLLSTPSFQQLSGLNSNQIMDGIHTSLMHGKTNVALFFKSNYKKEFTNFLSSMNKTQINILFDKLTMNGGLECIELLQNEIASSVSSKLDILLFLKKSLQYNQSNVFRYWLGHVKGEMFTNEKFKTQDLVTNALFYKKVKELKIIVDKFNLDLTTLIPFQGLGTIIEASPESLRYIIHECGYSPNAELVGKITTRFSQMSKSSNFYKECDEFSKLITVQKEKEKLARELAPISPISSASVVANKI